MGSGTAVGIGGAKLEPMGKVRRSGIFLPGERKADANEWGKNEHGKKREQGN